MKKQKSILDAASQTFLYKYLNNPSPTGFESAGQKNLVKLFTPFCR